MVDREAPRQRPDRAAWAYQSWRDMLFLHWPVPAHALRRHVPKALGLDLFEGTAWVTLLPFRAIQSRPRGLPTPWGLDFFEINLRTYVVHAGEPGIWFFSLDASSRLAVLLARSLFGLPYVYADIDRAGPGLGYDSRRRSGPHLHVRAAPGDCGEPAPAGSLPFFLLERYVLFVERGDAVLRGHIHHRPYPYGDARVLELDEDILAAERLPARGELMAHFSPGVDVEFFSPQLVGSETSTATEAEALPAD